MFSISQKTDAALPTITTTPQSNPSPSFALVVFSHIPLGSVCFFRVFYIFLNCLVKTLPIHFIHIPQHIPNSAVTIINANFVKIHFSFCFNKHNQIRLYTICLDKWINIAISDIRRTNLKQYFSIKYKS